MEPDHNLEGSIDTTHTLTQLWTKAMKRAQDTVRNIVTRPPLMMHVHPSIFLFATSFSTTQNSTTFVLHYRLSRHSNPCSQQ